MVGLRRSSLSYIYFFLVGTMSAKTVHFCSKMDTPHLSLVERFHEYRSYLQFSNDCGDTGLVKFCPFGVCPLRLMLNSFWCRIIESDDLNRTIRTRGPHLHSILSHRLAEMPYAITLCWTATRPTPPDVLTAASGPAL